MTKQNLLITICGRAGSQGFKNKNLKTFLGHPLVYYTLSAAELFKTQSNEIAEIDICLNTDSEDLYNIVNDKYSSVNYIKREESLGGNTVPKPAVWKNSLDLMENKYQKKYDCLIDLDITSPLRQINDIYNAYILKTERPDADLVESMCHSRRNPYFNMMKEDGNYVTTVIPSTFVARQQAPKIYDENASIYVLRASFFDEYGIDMNKAKTVPYIMKDTAVLDIDSEEDFKMMEIIGEYLFENTDTYKSIKDNIKQ